MHMGFKDSVHFQVCLKYLIKYQFSLWVTRVRAETAFFADCLCQHPWAASNKVINAVTKYHKWMSQNNRIVFSHRLEAKSVKSRCGLGCAPSESSPSGLGSWGFLGVSIVQNLPACVGDSGLIPGWGRSPGERNGDPPPYSYLGNLMDRGVWRATVHGVSKESDMTQRLNKQGLTESKG